MSIIHAYNVIKMIHTLCKNDSLWAKKTWPAHAMDKRLSSLPAYLGKRPDANLSIQQCIDEARAWKKALFTGP